MESTLNTKEGDKIFLSVFSREFEKKMNTYFPLNASFSNTLNATFYNKPTIVQKPDMLLDDFVFAMITTVMDVWINVCLSLAGIITNIINIIIFAKQGYTETVNISLTTISVLDSIRVVTGGLHRLYGPISLVSQALGITWQNLTIPNIYYVNIITGNVSYVIGAYVAIER